MNRFLASLSVALFLNGYHSGSATTDFRLPVTQGPSGATEERSEVRPAVQLTGSAGFIPLGRSDGPTDGAE